MKVILVLSFLMAVSATYGQKSPEAPSRVKVTYTDNKPVGNPIACFINGKFVGSTKAMAAIQPNSIEDLTVVKEETLISGVRYEGQVYITIKNDYELKLVSLTSLKDKYTNLGKRESLFMIDGDVVNSDYDTYFVDENNLLEIVVDDIRKGDLDLTLVKLLTKSEANIKKSKEIRIRGNEIALNK